MKKLSKIQLKAKEYAKRYVANGFNGTQVAAEMYNVKNREVAKSIAGENLTKPIFQNAIQEELENVLDRELRLSLIKRNAKQKSNLSASNVAIDMANKIAGDYAPEKKQNINITLKGEEIDKALQEKLNEYQRLKETTTA